MYSTLYIGVYVCMYVYNVCAKLKKLKKKKKKTQPPLPIPVFGRVDGNGSGGGGWGVGEERTARAGKQAAGKQALAHTYIHTCIHHIQVLEYSST